MAVVGPAWTLLVVPAGLSITTLAVSGGGGGSPVAIAILAGVALTICTIFAIAKFGDPSDFLVECLLSGFTSACTSYCCWCCTPAVPTQAMATAETMMRRNGMKSGISPGKQGLARLIPCKGFCNKKEEQVDRAAGDGL